jgi:hypothetical protein
MLSRKSTRLIFGLAAFALSTILGHSVSNAMAGVIQGEAPYMARPVFVSSIADAESRVGFEVSVPRTIPHGYTLNTIMIEPARGSATASPFGAVTQFWGSDGGRFFTLTQDPKLTGVLNATPYTLANREVAKVAYGPTNGRPYGISAYFWRSGDTGFALAGSVNRPEDERAIETIALSVDARDDVR